MTRSSPAAQPNSDAPVYRWTSLDDCRRMAQRLASDRALPAVIELNGPLGAGKTQWVRFWVEALGMEVDQVSSPTFVIIQPYRSAEVEVYHLDLYRVRDDDEYFELGIDELADDGHSMVIEWGARFAAWLPADRLVMDLDLLDATTRIVSLRATGPRHAAWLERFESHGP